MTHGRLIATLTVGLAALLGVAACDAPAPAPTPGGATPVTTALGAIRATTTTAPASTTTAPPTTSTAPPAPGVPLADISYDATAPLTDATDLAPGTTGLQAVTYRSTDDDPDVDDDLVTATVGIPAAGPGESCVVLLHGVGSDRSTYWINVYRNALNTRGIVTLDLDLRNHGDRAAALGWTTKTNTAAGLADVMADSARDVRRGFDWLAQEAGCTEFGIVGHSLGGMIGTIVAGADSRVDGLVTLSSGGNWDTMLRWSANDLMVRYSGRPSIIGDFGVSQTMLASSKAALAPVDPATWMRDRVMIAPLTMWHSTDPIIPSGAFYALANAGGLHGGRTTLTGGLQYHMVNMWTGAGGDLGETITYLTARFAD